MKQEPGSPPMSQEANITPLLDPESPVPLPVSLSSGNMTISLLTFIMLIESGMLTQDYVIAKLKQQVEVFQHAGVDKNSLYPIHKVLEYLESNKIQIIKNGAP